MSKPPPDERTTEAAIPASMSWPEPPPLATAVATSAPEAVAPTRRFDVPFELIAQTKPAAIDLGELGELGDLPLDGSDDMGVAVADMHAHRLAVPVEVPLAVGVPEPDALTADKGNRVNAVASGP